MPVACDPNTLVVTKKGLLISENRFMSQAYDKKLLKYRLFHINLPK